MRAAILCLLLAGCATAAGPVKIQCLPLKDYSAADQAEAEHEIEAAQQFPEITAMLGDYGAMRDADRACLAAKP